MLPLLIGAGVSQLCGILGNQLGGTATSPASGVASTGADFQQILADLQAGGSSASGATGDQTDLVANDLKSLLGDGSRAGAHHHHHHAQPGQASGTATPLQSIASSILAYAQTDARGPTATAASVTA